VGGRAYHVRVGDGGYMQPRRNKPGDMGHIDE
jgi:hypothetical protein